MTGKKLSKSEEFKREVEGNIARLSRSAELAEQSLAWMLKAGEVGAYTYNFEWLGRPIIQYPQDMVAMQELIWRIRPTLIVETGIAHGGSLIFSASMLALLDLCDAMESGRTLDPRRSTRKVVGVDIDIRSHNRDAIERHPLARMVEMVEGSSVDPAVVARVRELAGGHQSVLVCLDSNHTHDHVLAELQAYAPLVSPGSYCVVFDTVVDDMPASAIVDRPWGPGNSPKSAVKAFLKSHAEFEIDSAIHHKLMITVAHDGFLRRVA